MSLSQSSQEEYNGYSDHEISRIDTINDLNQITLNDNYHSKKHDTITTESSPIFNNKLQFTYIPKIPHYNKEY